MWRFYTDHGEVLEKITEATGCMIATGSYTGDGAVSKAITGVGFRPKFVAIWIHPTGNASQVVHIKLDQSWGDYAQDTYCAAAPGPATRAQDNRISSLDEDGFTVDDAGLDYDPNKNGETYDWLALGFGIGSVGTALMKTGTYTGDGSTGQAITGVGFQPRHLIIWMHPTGEGDNEIWRKLDRSWGDYAEVNYSADPGVSHAIFDNRINSLDADGFTVDDDGTDQHPNKNTQVYDYVAWGTG